MEFTAIARRLGLFSAAATVVLLAAYAVTLTIGLLSLESPDQPIRNPMFAILEILIIVMMPAIVGLMIAVHAWAPTRVKALSFAAVVFMGLLARLTSSLHFRHPDCEPRAGIRGTLVAAARLGVQVALDRLRP